MGRGENVANGRRDVSAYILAGVGFAMPVDPDRLVTEPGDDVQLPVRHEVVTVAAEIILREIGDPVGMSRRGNRTPQDLGELDRCRGGCRRQVGQALDVDAGNDEKVKPVDGRATDDGLEHVVRVDGYARLVEAAEGAVSLGHIAMRVSL